MARNKTISLSDEVFEKLKNEKNASAMIDSMLWKHYNEQKSITELQKELEAEELKFKLKEEANRKFAELEAERLRIKAETDAKLEVIL